MGAYRQLVAARVATRAAAALTGVSRATAGRAVVGPGPVVAGLIPEATPPVNRLSEAERGQVLAVLTGPEFIDATPMQIYAVLLERGQYLCSVATMYRILRANTLVRDRRRQARHPARARPELTATGPGQVFSWDITKLPGPAKGAYYDAYVMIDIYSRYIVGCHIHNTENAVLAEEMMREVFGLHGVPQVVHADRGTSMTSKTVAALLGELGVTRSHSRPKVSNDNPFSEAWFKTLKYAPVFPDRFGSLHDARAFMDDFVQYYNHEHHHTGIGLHTPADVHYGLNTAVDERRQVALAAARAANPERFSTTGRPKILNLPEAAWINPPIKEPATEPATQPAAA